jgi:hypothetical protein
LNNKPKINNVELSGNKTLSDLGIQPAGAYLTEVPAEYAKNSDIANTYLTKNDASIKYATAGSYNDLKNELEGVAASISTLNYNRVCIGEFTGEPKTGDLLIDL